MSERKQDVSRREFIGRSVVVSGATLAALTGVGCASQTGSMTAGGEAQTPQYSATLAQTPELQTVGGVKRVQYSGFDFFIVRKSETEVIALNNVCSHKRCKTNYNADERLFKCPCHMSSFDLDGNPDGGPALQTGALKRFPATLTANTVQVTLKI